MLERAYSFVSIPVLLSLRGGSRVWGRTGGAIEESWQGWRGPGQLTQGMVVRPWARRPTAAGNGNCLLHDLISSAAALASSRRFFPICPKVEPISRHTQHCPKSLVTVFWICLQFVPTRSSHAYGGACPLSLKRPLLHWVRLYGAVGFR